MNGYSNEFKIREVKMVTEQGYKACEAARQLDINPNLLGVNVRSEKTDVSESEINDHEDHKQEAVSENQHRSCPECGEGTLVNVETLQPTSGIVPTCSRERQY